MFYISPPLPLPQIIQMKADFQHSMKNTGSCASQQHASSWGWWFTHLWLIFSSPEVALCGFQTAPCLFLLTVMKVMWQLQSLFTQKSFMSPFSLIFLNYKDIKDKILFPKLPCSEVWLCDQVLNNEVKDKITRWDYWESVLLTVEKLYASSVFAYLSFSIQWLDM